MGPGRLRNRRPMRDVLHTHTVPARLPRIRSTVAPSRSGRAGVYTWPHAPGRMTAVAVAGGVAALVLFLGRRHPPRAVGHLPER